MAGNYNSFVKAENSNRPNIWKKFKEQHPEYKEIKDEDLKSNMTEFFRQTASFLVDLEHGVVLNGIGYLANAVYNKRRVFFSDIKQKSINNSLTDGDVYTSVLFPYVFKKNDDFLYWSFRITRHAARKMSQNIIKKGVRYKCHSQFLQKFNKTHKFFLNDKPSR